MKVRVFLKDPDAFYDAVREVEEAQAPKVAEAFTGVGAHPSADLIDAVGEEIRDAISRRLGEWIEFGECVTLEFDIEAGTARVVPLSELAEG